MPDDYEKYEKECERIRQENAKLLDEFVDSLAAKGLSEATINKHRQNMALYLNHFLLYEDAERPEAGVHMASRASIKSNAASLKKFYTFMVAEGKVTQEALDDLKTEIKEEMPEWLATLDRYDDPNIHDPAEIWGL